MAKTECALGVEKDDRPNAFFVCNENGLHYYIVSVPVRASVDRVQIYLGSVELRPNRPSKFGLLHRRFRAIILGYKIPFIIQH